MNNLFFLVGGTCERCTVACKGIVGNGLPGEVAMLIHYAYLAIQVAVPVVLILFGMIGFFKAIASQKEDEIRSAQNSFIKKLIIAVIVFLVLSIVHLLFNIVNNGNNSNNLWSCVDQLLDGNGCVADTTRADCQ